HRGIVVFRHGCEHLIGSARPEEPERFLDERPSRTLPARPRVDRDEVHVPDRRRPAEENPFEETCDRRSVLGHEEGPGAARPADREERVQAVERGPCDSHDGGVVGDGRVTNPHGARNRPRPKNVPVSASRCPVPSPGGRTGARGLSVPCGRSNSQRSSAAATCSAGGRTPRGPSPAARAGSPSSPSGSIPDAGGTSGLFGPFPQRWMSEDMVRSRGGVGESASRREAIGRAMEPEEASQLLIREYGRMARAYDAYVAPYHAPIARRLVELAGIGANERILDIG